MCNGSFFNQDNKIGLPALKKRVIYQRTVKLLTDSQLLVKPHPDPPEFRAMFASHK